MRRKQYKTGVFAQHLVFEPHDIQSDIDQTPDYQKVKVIKPVTSIEEAQRVTKNLNP